MHFKGAGVAKSARTVIPGVEKFPRGVPQKLSRGDRREYSFEGRSPYKPGAVARFFARDRAASLPIARSIRRCAGSRKAQETWSPESPSTGRSVRYKNPRWDTGGV